MQEGAVGSARVGAIHCGSSSFTLTYEGAKTFSGVWKLLRMGEILVVIEVPGGFIFRPRRRDAKKDFHCGFAALGGWVFDVLASGFRTVAPAWRLRFFVYRITHAGEKPNGFRAPLSTDFGGRLPRTSHIPYFGSR
jgi:hypothetical protein